MLSPWEVDTGPLETTIRYEPLNYDVVPTPEELTEIDEDFPYISDPDEPEPDEPEPDEPEPDEPKPVPTGTNPYIKVQPHTPEPLPIQNLPKSWIPSVIDLKAKLTDSWAAHVFVELYVGKIHYRRENLHGIQGWLIWSGTHWITGEGHRVIDLFQSFVEQFIAPLKDTFVEDALSLDSKPQFAFEIQKTFITYLKYLRSTRGIEQVLKLVSLNPKVNTSIEAFDTNSQLLNVRNGTLDFNSLTLRQHKSCDMITKYISIDYIPEAKCPMWEQFIREITCYDDDLADYLQRMAGYTLTGDTSEQLFFILIGQGRNGKSLFLNVIRNVLAGYAAQGTLDMLTSMAAPDGDKANPSLAGLKGSYLVTLSETRRTSRIQEHLVKQITGEDKIRTRGLYQDFFEFQPQFKMFLASNHRPVISDAGLGMWRRVRTIPFNYTVPEDKENPKLYSTLMDKEKEGILAWMVEGERKRQSKSLKRCVPLVVTQATSSYQADMDKTAAFLEEKTEKVLFKEVSVDLLYNSYKNWCDSGNESPLSKRNFSQDLISRGYVQGRNSTHTQRVWKDLILISP